MFFKDSAYSGYKLAFTVLRAVSLPKGKILCLLRHRRWQQRRDERRGRERRATRRATDAMRHKTARAYGYATHIKPQGFTSRPPLLTTNKVFLKTRWGAESGEGGRRRRWGTRQRARTGKLTKTLLVVRSGGATDKALRLNMCCVPVLSRKALSFAPRS